MVAFTAVRLSVGVSSSSEFSNFRLSEVEVARLWEACCWLAGFTCARALRPERHRCGKMSAVEAKDGLRDEV